MDLKEVSNKFLIDTSLTPVLALELEFYILGSVEDNFIVFLSDKLAECNITIYKAEKENGFGQYEVSLLHTKDILNLVKNYNLTKHIIADLANDFGCKVSFEAKPFTNQPASGLHIHLSLYNSLGQNVFIKENNKDSKYILYAIAGLLQKMKESMTVFAPDESDYLRYESDFLSPSNISWGGNNRTTAIRIPDSTSDPENIHIEHRVPCPGADIEKVISVILDSVRFGIINKLEPEIPRTYGNARDEQYNLEKFF